MNASIARRCLVGFLYLTPMGVLGCAMPDPMRMETEMRLETAMRLDGPITMNMKMEGPTIEYRGTFISEKLFDAVKEKDTRVEWVLAAFGEPDRRAATDTGGELMVWDYRAMGVQGSAVQVTAIGKEANATPPSMTVVLEVVEGTVIRKWRG